MADEQTQSTTEGQVQEAQVQAATQPEPPAQPQAQQPKANAQAEPADTTDWKAEARKWEARAKENKAKADAYDEAEEARKSDIQKATERAERAESELAAIKAQQARDAEVKAAAAKYGVDPDTLGRMAGDVEENAAFLQARVPKQPAYPQVNDRGEVTVPSTTKEEIEAEPDEFKRVMKRAQNIKLYQ